jgi:uroporphyrinogen-III synthase
VFVVPAFTIRSRAVTLPKGTFDYGLITSANAIGGLSHLPKAKKWIAIGSTTARAIKRSFEMRPIVLKNSHSEGVVQFFAALPPSKIFFPRSTRADAAVVKKLRRFGHKVHLLHTYDTKLESIRLPLLKNLRDRRIDSVFVTSPSSFESVKRSLTRAEVLNWKVKWIAIGPTTAKAMKKFGLKVHVAKQPSLAAMVKTLMSLFTKHS